MLTVRRGVRFDLRRVLLLLLARRRRLGVVRRRRGRRGGRSGVQRLQLLEKDLLGRLGLCGGRGLLFFLLTAGLVRSVPVRRRQVGTGALCAAVSSSPVSARVWTEGVLGEGKLCEDVGKVDGLRILLLVGWRTRERFVAGRGRGR